MAREILTACDVMDELIDMLGVSATGAPIRAIRRTIQQAVREITAAAKTPYMRKNGRLHLRAPYTTGTVTYDHTGGTYERQLTLVTGVWPTWSEDAAILLDGKVCDVESRKSDTVITLDVNLNPGADLAALTTYSMYPRYYRLPDDFDATSGFWGEDLCQLGREIPMDEMMALTRYYTDSGTVKCYAIGGIQDLVGHLGVFVYPKADAVATLDFSYYRKPREIRYTGKDAADYVGTFSVSTASTTLTGTSVSLSSKMVGSIVRIGDATNVPTGLGGAYPYVDERIIHGVSGNNLVVDRVPTATTAAAKYCVTDYIDIDPVFYDAFLARCRYDLAVQRNLPNVAQYHSQYQEQLHLAKCASCRETQPVIAGEDRLHLPQVITVGDYYEETY